MRDLIRSRIRRGKVEITVKWEENSEAKHQVRINEKILKDLSRQLSALSRKVKIDESLALAYLLQNPYCITVESSGIDSTRIWRNIKKLVNEALEKCYGFKVREGKALKRQLNNALKSIAKNTQEISVLKDTLIEDYRNRLRKRVEEFNLNGEFQINTERLEAEVLFYADKADITEELTRINSHLEGFEKYLADSYKAYVGKALDFLSQELLREVNTIASKSRDTEVSKRVLLMKNEVEKIREQVQNIE